MESGAEAGNDAARLVARVAPRDAEEVRALVEGSDHARTLTALGRDYAEDVAFCATLDAIGAVHSF